MWTLDLGIVHSSDLSIFVNIERFRGLYRVVTWWCIKRGHFLSNHTTSPDPGDVSPSCLLYWTFGIGTLIGRMREISIYVGSSLCLYVLPRLIWAPRIENCNVIGWICRYKYAVLIAYPLRFWDCNHESERDMIGHLNCNVAAHIGRYYVCKHAGEISIHLWESLLATFSTCSLYCIHKIYFANYVFGGKEIWSR